MWPTCQCSSPPPEWTRKGEKAAAASALAIAATSASSKSLSSICRCQSCLVPATTRENMEGPLAISCSSSHQRKEGNGPPGTSLGHQALASTISVTRASRETSVTRASRGGAHRSHRGAREQPCPIGSHGGDSIGLISRRSPPLAKEEASTHQEEEEEAHGGRRRGGLLRRRGGGSRGKKKRWLAKKKRRRLTGEEEEEVAC